MHQQELIPHLFRTEYRKLIAVLSRVFGMEHIEVAEDIVSDTFLLAAETWGLKGLPENPVAWLYAVSKNKARDQFRHNTIFKNKIASEILHTSDLTHEIEIDLSTENITDSQLQMMFAVCNPAISTEAQISLSLNILCGFGVDEIADAFLTTREATYKRLSRAKEKLRTEKIKIEFPAPGEIQNRQDTVLKTLYLLFSEGYYSASQNTTLRKDFCVEAMRLTLMLIENENTNTPSTNALLSLMCFHASRFDARLNSDGEIILYDDQDDSLWNKELIFKGQYYLTRSSTGNTLTKYHLEAAIAYWHTHKEDTIEKWQNILQLYDKLLQLEYSPIVALNRTYALSKAVNNETAIKEAEKLDLSDNHLYHSLLGTLYSKSNTQKALSHFKKALTLAKADSEKAIIAMKISGLTN